MSENLNSNIKQEINLMSEIQTEDITQKGNNTSKYDDSIFSGVSNKKKKKKLIKVKTEEQEKIKNKQTIGNLRL
jgi:hypothetical protein